jgi:hypothetical protein
MIPGTALYVYYGTLAGTIAAAVGGGENVARGRGYYALLGLGLIATAAVTAVITRVAGRALAQQTGDAPSSRGTSRGLSS